MAIACAYCGGSHDAPADVKRCWAESEAGATIDDDPAPVLGEPEPAAPRERSRAQPGPDALGRSAIVAPGQPAPPAWASAGRIVVTEATIAHPAETLARLRWAHHGRERLVIELAVAFDDPPGEVDHRPPFELGARFAFALDELHHLLWANSIDVREGAATWWLLDRAVAGGATPGGSGDVVLADGRHVWLDGGPVRWTPPIEGADVVHATAVEHGSLEPPTGNDTTADLAADQQAAVTHQGGGARIIAPAGSGKTRVLTERARHLISQWRLPPSAITLLAFNKRAQEEMAARTPDLPGLQVRTLNSLALAIVNGSPPFASRPRRLRTIDEPDVRRIIAGLVSFPKRRNTDPVAPWLEAMTLIRLGLVDPDEAEARYDGDVAGLAGVWPSYREILDRQGVVDFDDQVYRALEVLLTDAAARRAAQRSCRIMLVDEFQDLTPAHLLMIRLLAAPGGAVFGVGDDDQTIYGYNGADPGWLIDFAGLFPGAGEHPLEVNYRCPAGVVEITDRLLRHNRRRVAKTIRASSDDPGGWTIASGVDVVSASVTAVTAALAGSPPSEIAVLARVNAVLAPVQVALLDAGVPISGGVGLEFLDRTAVGTVLAWLRLAAGGPLRADDVREALRRPSRSFHPRINDWIAEQSDVVSLYRLAGRLNNERDADRLNEFAADVQSLQKLVANGAPTAELVVSLVDDVGIGRSVATLDDHRRGMNRAAQGDDLTAVLHLAGLHDDVATFESWLRSRLAAKRSAHGVTLSTVHRVKGQEWPHVVVHLADADQFPHRLAEDVEEERRLFHVAITRASTNVTIVPGRRASPFVAELATEPSADRADSATHPRTAPGRGEARGDRSARVDDPLADLEPAALARYDALRDLRNELRDGKPAYVVFDNKTLLQIARRAPATTSELARIPGVGPAKLDRYGDAILHLLSTMPRT